MDPTTGITIDVRPHQDGNPLHRSLRSTCQHGWVHPDMVVARQPVLLVAMASLAANHRVAVGCGRELLDRTTEA